MARSPAQRTLTKLRYAARDLGQVALRQGIVPEGRRQAQFLAKLFESSMVVDLAGNPVKLKSASRKHYLWKVRNGLDRRAFHMTNTTQRAAHAPQSFIVHANGFTISWPRANFKATVPGRPARPGKRARKTRSTFLNRYFRYINARSGFRLGKLGAKQNTKVEAAGLRAIDVRLKQVLGQAIKIKGGIKVVKLELGKLGLEKF